MAGVSSFTGQVSSFSISEPNLPDADHQKLQRGLELG